MMKKRYLGIVCLITACALLCCGCGDKGTAILIGETKESADVPAEGEQEASRASGQAGTAAQSAASGETASEARDTMIRVYVCGAVANPGVVEIPQGSRVEDALEAAGGFGAEAGREAVNLADWVSDGQKLYFPKEGEAVEEPQAQADSASGLVNINTADVAALCTLPGIGESRARDIISYREANGGFGACEDIMKVSGIKTAAYEKIKDKITVK
nr:helix-hairpin-helix domain-containing protein [uncultured Acetatifactor sp.]